MKPLLHATGHCVSCLMKKEINFEQIKIAKQKYIDMEEVFGTNNIFSENGGGGLLSGKKGSHNSAFPLFSLYALFKCWKQ